MYEKGLCMRRAFLLEKGAYIMLGRWVPNLLVLTSLRKAGFQIWSYLQNVGQQGSKYIGCYITLSRKFKIMVYKYRKYKHNMNKYKQFRKHIQKMKSGLQTPAGRPAGVWSPDSLLNYYEIFYVFVILFSIFSIFVQWF